MEKKTQKEIIDQLVTLIRENPDLPVVPIVDAEVVGDDYGDTDERIIQFIIIIFFSGKYGCKLL